MSGRGTASHGPRTQAMGHPKAPVHKIGESRLRSRGRSVGPGGGPGGGVRREALPMSHIACGSPPARRIARAISTGGSPARSL